MVVKEKTNLIREHFAMTIDQRTVEWTKEICIDQVYKLLNQPTICWVAETLLQRRDAAKYKLKLIWNRFSPCMFVWNCAFHSDTYRTDFELGFWRRFPKEAWNQNISIRHFYHKSAWIQGYWIAIFFYTWSQTSTDYSRIRLHLNTITSQHGSHHWAGQRDSLIG